MWSHNTYIAQQAATATTVPPLCHRAGVQPIGRRLSPRPLTLNLQPNSHAALVCRLMVSTPVVYGLLLIYLPEAMEGRVSE